MAPHFYYLAASEGDPLVMTIVSIATDQSS